MNKQEFLRQLKAALCCLPEADSAKSVSFYEEIINDRMEDGMSEEEAVASLGDVQVIARQIIRETPIVPKTFARVKNNDNKVLFIVLAILLFPLWFPLLCTVFGLLLGAFGALFGIIIALFATVFGLGVASVATFAGVFIAASHLNAPVAFALLGISLLLTGFTILLTIGVIQATKGIVWLIKKLAQSIKSCFTKTEGGVL